MPLNFFYTMVQKSQKWPKTQIKGGSSLKLLEVLQLQKKKKKNCQPRPDQPSATHIAD